MACAPLERRVVTLSLFRLEQSKVLSHYCSTSPLFEYDHNINSPVVTRLFMLKSGLLFFAGTSVDFVTGVCAFKEVNKLECIVGCGHPFCRVADLVVSAKA